MVHNAVHKMQNPIDKMFFLGFLAGIWVGFGGIAGKVSVPFLSQVERGMITRDFRINGGRRHSHRSPSAMANASEARARSCLPFRIALHHPFRWRTIHRKLYDISHRPLESIHSSFQSTPQFVDSLDCQLPRVSDLCRFVLLQNGALCRRTLPFLCSRSRI